MNRLGERNFEVSQNAIDLSGVADVDQEKIRRACDILAAAGVRVVPADVIQVKRELMQSLLTLARERMDGLKTVEQLTWD